MHPQRIDRASWCCVHFSAFIDTKYSSTRAQSTDTLRTRRSHSSRERRDRRKDDDRERRRSRDRYRDRSKDRYRDKDHRRDGHRSDRSDRHRDGSRHSHRDRDREDRDRRRKRDEDGAEDEDRPKRLRTSSPSNIRDSPALGRDRSVDRRRRDDYDRDRRRQGGRRRDDLSPPRRRRSPPPRTRSPPPPRDPSPPIDIIAAPEETFNPDEPREDDSEARSVFVSQLAARLTAKDLGYFFEDKLGHNTVMDSRIVTDRISRRSKGIGYVEFRTVDLVEKALNLSGTVVMGLPILVQLTEAERNRLHPGDGNLNLPPGVSAPHGSAMQLYVGSLHFNLTESDIKQVFEPFGDLEFVDLHRDPLTGRSKGYAFVQYKRSDDARMALEQMDGFELAGRQLRVNTVHEKGTVRYTTSDSLGGGLDDGGGGGNLNAASRQALMQKLARIDEPEFILPESKPHIPQSMTSRSVLLKDMFNPDEEEGDNWDKELAEEVKNECSTKYGNVLAIKVERESQGEIYVKFESVDAAKEAVQGLNGRWFGGNQISAVFISDAIMQAHQ
ncbi:splicing factor, CC1-like protein [Cylindrobasidium torrendii FP15055 ss-10]|uniref:Splicing factor, CC1-like protein n=1 Tax=Cylindrobasidium torrendii FP15055 ss-10 TaxID=1314674 RepID=A0A0D7B231_9AGAR|nr:splicing factor, CC1-like protein [Cylindrobasidium torrendii FP15055 ss-10]